MKELEFFSLDDHKNRRDFSFKMSLAAFELAATFLEGEERHYDDENKRLKVSVLHTFICFK